eukprot:CAMPEP_0172687064 /NCGR_PEP_ID=MMETSP1074-20121228/21401_1 /TAXON_ID=2916 /ORGANISM="Ceratium fusus, Strain PA161109" /LENGTH=149 /DNA_ID=CAMNT_0013506471 /DNA_START=434 /DNA_END=883 /DNA_ORIENTATION=-
MVLNQQTPIIVTLDPQHLLQALVNEHIFAPKAWTGAQPCEVVDTTLPPSLPLLHCTKGKDLQRSMHPHSAIIDVSPSWALCVMGQVHSQPRRQEDTIGVYLYSPGVEVVAFLRKDRIPDCEEDFGVQRCLEFAPITALQVAVNKLGFQA